ncbi:MAG: NYN domain-containing protein [Acidimicrobiia bacterium]|nr:NYN domain-containing protein [Acidimicrobiia bacterium]
MTISNDRLKIAVFIDFDNVEIGVKTTIGGQFDVGLVLEAIKERGEIVTKIAYSDWQRVGDDYSRQMTQHAIRMVQRNFTPGGDKNGADITMALDALEMAFTHDHINAFVIVGGDSDFISLVEKLKQYDRKIIVVGGRQFTSATMQKNCHEFVAYENLVGTARATVRQQGRGQQRPYGGANIEKALPLVKRALKVLSEREVSPQLGLLKSTLLQLDSTFSERDYGSGSFRDFMEKVAKAGAVTLRHSGRSLLVEVPEDEEAASPVAGVEPEEPLAAVHRTRSEPDAGAPPPAAVFPPAEGVRALKLAVAGGSPRWPMYLRQMKQFLRGRVEGFEERQYGFASLVDLLRAGQRDGLVRLERDRKGVMRVFPGDASKAGAVAAPVDDVAGAPEPAVVDAEAEVNVMAADVVDEVVTGPPVMDAEVAEAGGPEPAQARRRTRARKAPRSRKAAAKTASPAKTRTRASRAKANEE